MKSTHKAEVIPLVIEKHPNADKLGIVRNGLYTLVVNLEDWKDKGDKAIHILPDSVVDVTREEFKWLDKGNGEQFQVVRPVKLRGIQSYGFLVPAPIEAQLGEDYTDRLGITHYEPEDKLITGDCVRDPVNVSKYDLDTAMKYHWLFQPGQIVYAEEKIHGANCRMFYSSVDKCIYVGSRSQWKLDMPGSLFWRAMRSNPFTEEFLRKNPDKILYGEAYGDVKNYKYDCGPNQTKLAAFDVFDLEKQVWMDYNNARELGKGLTWAPLVEKFEWDKDKAIALATGPSLILGAKNEREGIVITPEFEMRDDRLGRVKLKIVSPNFKG